MSGIHTGGRQCLRDRPLALTVLVDTAPHLEVQLADSGTTTFGAHRLQNTQQPVAPLDRRVVLTVWRWLVLQEQADGFPLDVEISLGSHLANPQ